ncbi:MAG: hypothetical protein KIT25_14675 [Enhydrobacter sp.]|nr:MAG: hypothetical protein KIT25_14675 [Enhydrobacter sp.]
MRVSVLLCAAGIALAACGDPVRDQALIDTRYDPVRADTMLAVGFIPGSARLDTGQVRELHSMVAEGRRAQRDEFIVVTDGSGGAMQLARARLVGQSLSDAGARWVGTSVEPAMAMGPDQVVIVRSEYRLVPHNCPTTRSQMWNPNESISKGFGCADAYNFGQMLARPRDAAIGRDPGTGDGTVAAEAVQRYREGRVRQVTGAPTTGSSGGAAQTGSGGASGSAGSGS